MRIPAALAGLGVVLLAGLPLGAGIADPFAVSPTAEAVDEAGAHPAPPPQQARPQQTRPQQAPPHRGRDAPPQQARERQGQGQGNQQRPQQARERPGQGNQRPQQAQEPRGRGNQRAEEPRQQRGPNAQRGRPAQPGRSGEAPGRSGETPGRSGEAPGRSGEAPGQQRALGAAGPAAGAAGDAARVRRGGRPLPHEEVTRRIAALSPELQRWTGSNRRSERYVAAVVVHGAGLGLQPERLTLQRQSSTVMVRNPGGELLLELDERGARELGFWEVRRLGDRRPHGNSPAFCRSGAGHPVWGRDWCLERGFGLGSRVGTIWSRAEVDDVVFRRTADRDRLARDVLIGVLGDAAFNRLALHALSMGYSQPLHGHWVTQPAAPRILHVYSGDVVVAELVDVNRTDRVDVIYVLQPL